MRYIALLLGLLCVTGCVYRPADTSTAPVSTTPSPVSVAQMPKASLDSLTAPAALIPPYDVPSEALLPARRVSSIESDEALYLRNSGLMLQDTFYQDCYRLVGERFSFRSLEELARTLHGIPARDIRQRLAEQGVYMPEEDAARWKAGKSSIVEESCDYAFGKAYVHIHLVSAFSKNTFDLFFVAQEDGYSPYAMLRYDEEGFLCGLVEFGAQQWLIYAFGDSHWFMRIGWYNLNTRQIELCYAYTIRQTGPVAEDVLESEWMQVLPPEMLEDSSGSRLVIPLQQQWETTYLPVEEDGDIIVAASEPDAIAIRTEITLHYDLQANAFYTHTPVGAYPLNGTYGRRQWLYYIMEDVERLAESDDVYQRRWGKSFLE